MHNINEAGRVQLKCYTICQKASTLPSTAKVNMSAALSLLFLPVCTPSWRRQGKFHLYLSSSIMDRHFLSHYTNTTRDNMYISQHSRYSWRNHHQIILNSPKYSLYIWVNISTLKADMCITISNTRYVRRYVQGSLLLRYYVVLTGKKLPMLTKVQQSQVYTSRTALPWRWRYLNQSKRR
jgi:hypothetical protein